MFRISDNVHCQLDEQSCIMYFSLLIFFAGADASTKKLTTKFKHLVGKILRMKKCSKNM